MGSNSHISTGTSTGDPRDAAIAAIARRQHGNVTVEQLQRVGLSDNAISYRARVGRLFRVYRGVYAVGRPPLTLLERAAAAVLACGPGAALSHASAAWVWDFHSSCRPPFHVTVPGDRRQRGITVHRATGMKRNDLIVQRGVLATSPARTLLDWAPTLPADRLTRAVNDARLSKFLTDRQLAQTMERFPRHAGVKLLTPLLAASGGPTRSDLEDAFVEFCAAHDLPAPQTAIHVCGREVDAYFPEQRVIVELDSWTYHSDRGAFHRDRDQDATALAHGIATVRVTHERMTDTPAAEAERLRTILRARAA